MERKLAGTAAIRTLLAAVFIAGMTLMSTARTIDYEHSTQLIDRQVADLLKILKGKRVAFLTCPTGLDGRLTPIADLVLKEPGTSITAFFAPEHGLRGDIQAGDKVTDYIDPVTSVPVYSVYGKQKAPTGEQLAGTDVLVFDAQDVGVRFYTFAWSMTYAMEAAARNKVKFVVFDRPNPINGLVVQGAVNTTDTGIVGRVWPGHKAGIATRHGLTMGELATLVNEEWLNPKADLHVVRMHGYERSMHFEDTGRLWVIPSPNMPTVETAIVYPGMCVFEGSNISEGRGTTKPFEQVGAPYVDGHRLATHLNALGLPGVRFRQTSFKPTFGKHAGKFCNGVEVLVTDRMAFDPIRTGLHVVKTILSNHPNDARLTTYSSTLMGDSRFHERILREDVESIMKSWEPGLEEFKKLRAKHLLY